jgi:hypothetical protein
MKEIPAVAFPEAPPAPGSAAFGAAATSAGCSRAGATCLLSVNEGGGCD